MGCPRCGGTGSRVAVGLIGPGLAPIRIAREEAPATAGETGRLAVGAHDAALDDVASRQAGRVVSTG